MHRHALLVPLLASCRGPAPAAPDAARPRVDWQRIVEEMPNSGNLIPNGGFEDGRLTPWYVPTEPGWIEGTVTDGARTGARSLRATVTAQPGGSDAQRAGAMFQVGSLPFPRHAELYYNVDRWQPANSIPYVFFAVLVAAGERTYQIRYLLAGPDAIPYNEDGNVRFVLVQKGPPRTGQWVRFSTDLHRDFQILSMPK